MRLKNLIQKNLRNSPYTPPDKVSLTPPLREAMQATVLLMNRSAFGTGVIVRHAGKKYLLTASHLFGTTPWNETSHTYLHALSRFDSPDSPLQTLRYSAPTATHSGDTVADLAVFDYEGERTGVELVGNLPEELYTLTLGFPTPLMPLWGANLQPLVCYGTAHIPPRYTPESVSSSSLRDIVTTRQTTLPSFPPILL